MKRISIPDLDPAEWAIYAAFVLSIVLVLMTVRC